MPLPTEKLTKKSSKEAVRSAISACIAQEIKAGREQDQAVAMCLRDAFEHAGGKYVPKRVTVKGQ